MTSRNGIETSFDQRPSETPGSALSAWSDALYELHRSREASSLPAKIVSVVSRLIPCSSALLIRVDPSTATFSLTDWPEGSFSRLDAKKVAAMHVRDHPLVDHFRFGRDSKAWGLHDLVSPEAFRQTALYRNLYRSLGVEYQLVLLVPYPDHAPRALVLNRRETPFSENERELLELLWPHLALAVRTSRAATRRKGVATIDGLLPERGVLVLNLTGGVELCTEQARVWLTHYCVSGYPAREIRSLPEPVAGWIARALADQKLHVRGIAAPLEPLIVRRGDQFLAMRFIADYGRGQHLVLMEETAMNCSPNLLQGMNLTPRESEVLAWVAQGKTNRETGTILGMSTRTVQKHLERIFAKLGVETRTGAILKAWQAGRFDGLVTGIRTGAAQSQ